MSQETLRKLLLPDEPQDFPGRRLARSILRAMHILGGGVLSGSISNHLSRKFRHHPWLKFPDITQDQRYG
jgi:hypothetical protein